MNISKQTVSIVKDVWKSNPPEDWQVTYLPHGVSEKFFKPISKFDKEYDKIKTFRKQYVDDDVEFILFYNNRNIRRKMPGDVILAFKTFCDMLSDDERKKVCLLMHTQPIDDNGTDLPEVARSLAPGCKVYFSDKKLEPDKLNYMYNMVDVTLNIASNEGFGLGTCESLMAGTPIIVNVTGGLQDQCGFKLNGNLLKAEDYDEIKSLHDWRKWENNKDLTHGEWVKPVWPKTRALQGSPQTPYIFDDRADWYDAANQIYNWYKTSDEDRQKAGQAGHEYVMDKEVMMGSKAMSQNFIDHMELAMKKWKPRKRYSIFKVGA